MAHSSANLTAILLGLGIFLIVVAVGWRSVQNRRILRMQDAQGHETIIVASEDDDVSSVVTTTETSHPASVPAPSATGAETPAVDPVPVSGGSAPKREAAV